MARPDAGPADRRLVQHGAGRAPARRTTAGWQVIGDPTEGALVVAALKAEVEAQRRGTTECSTRSRSIRNARRCRSSSAGPTTSATMYTKGAPEVILARCDREWRHGRIEPLTPERRARDPADAAAMASRALRVLALADRHHPDPGHEAVRREEGPGLRRPGRA